MPAFFVLQDVSSSGDRALLISAEDRQTLLVRRAGQPPRDLSWLGFSIVSDLSPDEKNILFYDGGATRQSAGTWIRPVEGGDAIRLAANLPSRRLSPDGRWVVTISQPMNSEPQQVLLLPVNAGERRQITTSKRNHRNPSFATATTILYVESSGSGSEVWRMETDGSGARSLGAPDCDSPVADPKGKVFLCISGASRSALAVHPLGAKGEGRTLFKLPKGGFFS